MAIETIGGMNNILKMHDSSGWAKSVELEVPNVNLDHHEKKVSFSEMLANSLKDVNNLQVEANKAIEQLTTGKTKNIHETMLSVEKAEIAFKTMNQIRMKVIDAYREVMKMQM